MIKNRLSIRLKNYDYSQQGLYFITICTQNRKCIFGEIIDGKMVLNEFGLIINKNWKKLINRFHVQLDEYVTMPNHFHGIIGIKQRNPVGVSFMKPSSSFMKPEIKMAISKSNHHMGLINQTPTLGLIIRYFKSKCTYEIHQNKFIYDVFQRNYYEHIIRNENNLHKIRIYISKNPTTWERDRNNPKLNINL